MLSQEMSILGTLITGESLKKNMIQEMITKHKRK